jgi:hypothetical protein
MIGLRAKEGDGGLRMSCCPDSARTKKIEIGGILVGIVGYEKILEEAEKFRDDGEERIRQVLLKQTKIYNYVTPGSEKNYEDAMWKEFQVSMRRKESQSRRH